MSEAWKVFFALGDPHRLEMVKRLARRGPTALTKLFEGLPVSRQASTKHLEVLVAAGFVTTVKQGRERIAWLDKGNLLLAKMYMEQMEGEWDDRLARLRMAAEE